MIKVKDGYAKLIGTEYKGNGSRLLVTNGGDVGYSSESIASNIVQRNANQHVFATYYQSNISDEAISSIGSIYVRNTFDNYIRRVSKAQFYTVLGEKFVTLDTAQTISGSKTFSQQIKSTVDTTKPPFIINSNKCVQNLNADLLDDWQLVDIVKSGSITCGVQGLSSYWGKMWDTTVTSNYNDVDITLYVHSVYMQQWGIIGIRARLNKSEDARSMNVSLSGIVGNLPQDRFRLYYNVSSGLCQLWCNVNVRYGVYNYIVLSKTNRNTVELANNGNFYSSDFTTAQSLPSDEYADLEYIGIRNNSATSTKLQTARTINGTAFDGTQNITTAIWGSTRTISLTGAVTGSVSTNGGANITISTSYGDMSSLNSRYLLGNTGVTDGNNVNTKWLTFADDSAGIGGKIGVSDFWRICGRSTSSDKGYLEIATADSGNEPIYIRQYQSRFTTLTRTLTLLDSNGNTLFPGIIQATALNINSANPITWNNGSVQQRIAITDNTTSNVAVFNFQQSTDSGSTFTLLASIYDNGTIHSTGFVKTGGTGNQYLKADGSVSSDIDRQKISNLDVNTLTGNTIYWTDTDANSATLTNRAFSSSHALLQINNYIQGEDYRRSRIAFNTYGELKVFDDRNTSGNGGVWYDVLTKKNYSTIIGIGNYYTKSESDSRFVNVTGDTMTGPLKFNGATGIGFNSTNIEGADNIGTTIKIHVGQDGASQDKANLRIGSWYGVGWYPTIENHTVAKGKHAMWLNVRNGNLNIVGTFEAGGNVVTRSRAIAQRGGRTDKVALFQSNAENQGGIVLTDKTNTEHILYLTTSNLTWKGRKVWDSGNDGAGSGLDADLLDGLDGSNYIRRWNGGYQRYSKVLKFTREQEKGWMRLSIYTSSNAVCGEGGEYIIGWNYNTENLEVVECLYARGNRASSLLITKEAANTYTIWFDNVDAGGKPNFVLLGYIHAQKFEYFTGIAQADAPENVTYTAGYSTSLYIYSQSGPYITQHTGNNINYPIVWSNQNNTNSGFNRTLYKSHDKLWFNPSTFKLYAAGGFVGNADSATKALSADKLTTSRTLWGQPFDGTQNVTGNITVNGNILNVSVIQSSDDKYVDIKSPNHGIAFYSKGSLKAVIKNSGNFGIGTSSPSQKLHVVGKALSDGYMKNGSSDSYVLLGGGGHKALSNLANATDLSKYVPLTQPNTIYTSGTTPYNYVYLFRIANSSGYSTAMADIEIKARYGRIRLWVDIRTPEHPYGDGDDIYITKEPWSNNWSSKRIWYKRTQVTSGYNYYDVYLECGAWNSGQYGIVQKGGLGLIYEPKGQNLDSLPSGCTEVQYRSIDSATLSGWTTSNFYNEFTGNQWYHLYIDNSDTTGSTWYKVCSVKFTGEEVPAYLARKINGYLYDSKSNWQSNSTEIIPFQIVINLSNDTATIYSTVMWNSSKLRVLKIGTRNYEIQFFTGSNYLDSNIYYTLEGNNTYVTCYTKLEQATSGSTYITSCSQLNSYGNNSYHSTSSDTATTANKLGSSTIGSATVPIYLNAGSPKACSSTSAATANTIAVRDGSGDLLCRLVRANYADQNTMSGGIVFRINNSGDNYLRCCNNPSAVRSWLGIGSSGDYVTALGTIGNNLTWTKNGTTNNIIIPYATNSGKVANSLVLKFNSGTTEGTNLYTFNGSSGKTIDIRPGSNVQFATTSGTVVISSTNTTYSQATSSTLGLVKIGYGEDGKNYPVELNGSGQMYVNVPWTDNNTTYTAGTNLTLNGNKFSVKVGSTNAGNRVVGTAEDGTIYESEALTSELQYLLSDWRGTTGIMTLLGKKQNTITGGATTITSSNLTASRVLVSNSSGKVAVSSITSAQLGYLNGVTSSIQTQLNTIKANCIYRGVCSTSANTAAKTVSVDGNFTLTAGVFVAIRFEQMNAASNPTLNVNNTGAKAIFYRGAAWKTSQDPARQYDTILMTYDGTQWMISALLEPNKVNFSNASSTLRAKNFNLDTSTSSNGTITRTSGIQDLYFDSDILSTTSGLFPHSSNANACITVKTNSGNYYHQIGLSSNKKMYARSFQNVVPNSTTSWYTIPYCEDSQDWTGYQDFQSGAGNSGSDMRFKKEVQNVGNILSKINDLNVIKYIWEHPDESQVKYTFGIDANKLLELGGIFATMVHSRNDKHDTKWVEYDRFGVLAIKAIQELCQTIQQMKNRIEILENKICLNSI